MRKHKAIELNEFHDPARIKEVEQLHVNAFNWQRQDYIPLGIWVVNREHARNLNYSDWLQPESWFAFQVKVLSDTLRVGSDILPVIGINHLGTAVIPSLFNACFQMPARTLATLQENGPTPLPVLNSIKDVSRLAKPSLQNGILPQATDIARYYRQNLPQWVSVGAPAPGGIFSTAMELRGTDFLTDIIDEPELACQLLNMCAELRLETELYVRQAIGASSDKKYTNFGICTPGLRLSDDSICNISPQMIKTFFLPFLKIVSKGFGGRGHVHFCSLPGSRFEHIYRAFAEADDVQVISSQFGFEYYAEHLDEIRNRLAVEAMYAPAYKYICARHGSFENWAARFVPKYKNESGLVLYLQVDSLEEGHHVWKCWQKAHCQGGK